jgi:ribosome-associated protein
MAKTARAIKTTLRSASDLLAESVIKGLQEKKGHDIVCLDLRKLKNSVTDIFIVCHGDSKPQVEALTRSVEEIVHNEIHEWPTFIEGTQNAQWVLIDYINVVVHVFLREQRDYYGIERLWADAEIKKIPD